MNKSKSKKNRRHKPPPIYKGDPFVFEVDQILKKRKNGDKTEYLIKWSGYPDSENAWIDESDITEDLTNEFNLQEKEGNRLKESLATDESLVAINPEYVSLLEEYQNNDFYLDDDFDNLGCNLLLQSVTEDFQLFSIGTKANGSNVNAPNQDQSIESRPINMQSMGALDIVTGHIKE
ncbi:hypothetical protein HA402_006989 [Bradysia odoriphaga]|nr:hypothetical protein HA402_006989 [Bradysia odoriphaga]